MTSLANYRFLPVHLVERLDGLGIGVRMPLPGGAQGRHRSRHHGASVEFADYRAYAPGDPVQRIDWSVYARSDRYLVRRFEDETRLRVNILIDTSLSMGFQAVGATTKLEHACYLAAGTMYVLVRQGDVVALHGFAQTLDQSFPSTSSAEGLRPLLRGLEEMHPAGAGSIDQVLHQFADGQRPTGLIVVISDFLQDAQLLLSSVRHLVHAGNQVVLLQVLDRGEITLPFSGVVEVAEMETGRRVIVEIDQMREAYMREVQAHMDALRRGCSLCGAVYQLAETSQPVDEALRAGLSWI